MIAVDLPRTWPGLDFVGTPGPFYEQLETVLHCYALFRPDIGYVQGMTFLAAMLGLFLNTTYDVFVAFANLLHSHFFLSHFTMDVEQVSSSIY
jgi:hypothetical protein